MQQVYICWKKNIKVKIFIRMDEANKADACEDHAQLE